MIRKKQIALLVVLATLSLSCSEKVADKVGDAQKCLDDYTSKGIGTLDQCEAKIVGVTTPAAYNIRCAAGYLREGFVTQTFIDAFDEISTVSAGNVVNFLDRMTFDSEGTIAQGPVESNYANVQTVYSHCAKSFGKGATILATFSYLVNSLYNYECNSGGGTCKVNDTTLLASTLASVILDGTARATTYKSDLGSIVVSTHQVSCSASEANETLCEFLDRAITNAGGPDNTAAVGQEFLEVLATP